MQYGIIVLKRFILGLLIAVAVFAVIGLGIVYIRTYEAMDDVDAVLAGEVDYVDEKYWIFGENRQVMYHKDSVNIVIYQGGLVETEAYAILAQSLADEGYRVFLPKMPFNLAILNKNSYKDLQEQYGHEGKWVVVGHSLGGASAVMSIHEDESTIDGLVLLAAYGTDKEDMTKSELDILSIVGDKDRVVNRYKFDRAKKFMTDSVEYNVIEGGNHAYFGYYGEQEGDGHAMIGREEQHSITVALIADFVDSIDEDK